MSHTIEMGHGYTGTETQTRLQEHGGQKYERELKGTLIESLTTQIYVKAEINYIVDSISIRIRVNAFYVNENMCFSTLFWLNTIFYLFILFFFFFLFCLFYSNFIFPSSYEAVAQLEISDALFSISFYCVD